MKLIYCKGKINITGLNMKLSIHVYTFTYYESKLIMKVQVIHKQSTN